MGCLGWIITLPFRMVYWFFKLIWEMFEHFGHRRHYRRRGYRRTNVSRAYQRAVEQDQRDTDRLNEIFDESWEMANSSTLSLSTRREALNVCKKVIDKMVSRGEVERDIKRMKRLVSEVEKTLEQVSDR